MDEVRNGNSNFCSARNKIILKKWSEKRRDIRIIQRDDYSWIEYPCRVMNESSRNCKSRVFYKKNCPPRTTFFFRHIARFAGIVVHFSSTKSPIISFHLWFIRNRSNFDRVNLHSSNFYSTITKSETKKKTSFVKIKLPRIKIKRDVFSRHREASVIEFRSRQITIRIRTGKYSQHLQIFKWKFENSSRSFSRSFSERHVSSLKECASHVRAFRSGD